MSKYIDLDHSVMEKQKCYSNTCLAKIVRGGGMPPLPPSERNFVHCVLSATVLLTHSITEQELSPLRTLLEDLDNKVKEQVSACV